MYADADDVLDTNSVQRVRDAVKHAEENGFNMIVSEYYTQHDADGKPTANNRVPRLVKAGLSRWRCRIHEYQECGLPRQYLSNIDIHQRKPIERVGGTQRNTMMLEKAMADPKCDKIEKPRYLFYLAREYMFAGRYQDAIETFNKYIPISTYPAERHRAMCDRADCWSSIGERYKAMESLCAAIEFLPDLPDPYIKLGIIAYNQDDWVMCVKWLRDAAARSGNIHPLFPLASYNSYLPYDYMSVAYHKIGEIEKAYVCELKVFKYLKNDKRINDNIKFFENALGLT
jgi:tetratricopeptide (TPR) repeat protein